MEGKEEEELRKRKVKEVIRGRRKDKDRGLKEGKKAAMLEFERRKKKSSDA